MTRNNASCEAWAPLEPHAKKCLRVWHVRRAVYFLQEDGPLVVLGKPFLGCKWHQTVLKVARARYANCARIILQSVPSALLWWSNEFDLHREQRQSHQFRRHARTNALEHGRATWHHAVGAHILAATSCGNVRVWLEKFRSTNPRNPRFSLDTWSSQSCDNEV